MSPVMGVVLMLIVTLILAALVLLMMVQLPYMYDQSVPSIFKITKIRHVDDHNRLTYDSRMMIMNTATIGYKNMNLYGLIYRNGDLLACSITTLNGHAYIPTHHYKIQNLGGQGSRGTTWDPGELIFIDFAERTFHPGDVVTLEVYDVATQQIISRHTYTA
jgi:hypothetical protein